MGNSPRNLLMVLRYLLLNSSLNKPAMNTRLPSKITIAIPGEKPVHLTVLGVTESGDELFIAVAMPDGYLDCRCDVQDRYVPKQDTAEPLKIFEPKIMAMYCDDPSLVKPIYPRRLPAEPRQTTRDELFADLERKAHAQTERAIAEIRGKIDAAAEAHTPLAIIGQVNGGKEIKP